MHAHVHKHTLGGGLARVISVVTWPEGWRRRDVCRRRERERQRVLTGVARSLEKVPQP